MYKLTALSRIIHSINPTPRLKVYLRLCVSRHIVPNKGVSSISRPFPDKRYIPDSVVIEETLNASDRTDSNILIPKLPLRKAHDVLFCDSSNDTLNLLWTHAATGCDDLSSDILCHSGGTIKGKEDRCLQLGLGSLNLSLADVVRKSGPFTESKVDKVVDSGQLVGNQVDAPESADVSSSLIYSRCRFLPSITVTCRKAHEAVGQIIVVDESAKLAAHVWSIAHCLVPVSDNCLGDQSSEVIIILPANTLHSNGNVGSWNSIITDSDLGTDELGFSLLGSSNR